VSAIDTVRAIVQDQPILVQETKDLDGVQKSVRMTYWPLVASTLKITTLPTPDIIDEQSGLLTWTATPAIGTYLFEYGLVMLLDATIQTFINLYDGATDADSLRLAAADCLDAMATSQALIQKRITLLDLKTDGPAVAESLRAHAKALRDMVFSPEYAESTFDIVEQINNSWGFQEKLLKDALREEG
jgi:hypothetical protein